MRMQAIAGVAIVAGLLLVVLSLLWPTLYDPRVEWTDEDAQAYQETVARVHGGEKLTASGQDLKSRLESARERPYRVARVLRWSGAGLVVLGVVGFLLGRQRNT
jgi:hypothetical protein